MKLSNRKRLATVGTALSSAAVLETGCSSTGNNGSLDDADASDDLNIWGGSWVRVSLSYRLLARGLSEYAVKG